MAVTMRPRKFSDPRCFVKLVLETRRGMKSFPLTLVSCLLAATASARLGDTQDAAEARYGFPKKRISTAQTILLGARELTFEFQGWRIQCGLLMAFSFPANADFQGSTHLMPFDDEPISYSKGVPNEAVARLQQKIDKGEVTLKFEPGFGYIRSVLQALKVP